MGIFIIIAMALKEQYLHESKGRYIHKAYFQDQSLS